MSSVSSLSSSAINSEIATVTKQLEAPITNLQTQITSDKAIISAWGSISGAVSSLTDSLSNIKSLSTINNRAVTSSDTAVATASVNSSAATGAYNLTGVTLAKGQEIYSGLVSSGAATLSGGAGSLAITLKSGKSETISLGSGSMTLSNVAAAINKQAGGVKASIVSSTNGARLVLNSSGTGSSAAFSVSGTGALAQFSYSSASPGSEVLVQTAANAALTLNGIPITSASNTLGSAIAGVTISLASSGNASVSVSSSPVALSSDLSGVAKSLNAAITAIASQTKYTSAKSSASGSSSSSAKAGVLLGNFSATNLKNQLMSAVSTLESSGLSANAIGLSVTSSGGISFNSTAFSSAYAKSPTSVGSLVSKLYTSLSNIAASATGKSASSSVTGTSITGFISAQTKSLNDSINSIEQQITLMTKQSSATLKNLANEYTAAENKASSASIVKAYLSVFSGSSSSSSG
ncbi:flagellar filament capping protein FliD [Acidocella aminolytica]|uniref:flagellar filament capping protein FliD n=1 Tax=Acidocella aminolytica TaxID=33998 RepID=UPI00091F2736|nr:flagellar filament capping protein FliD [Acidocella aminolytica]SHE57578.1 flagellar hook-associated protein 2 [Acidocella aminolytica 101 = DSM 11237]